MVLEDDSHQAYGCWDFLWLVITHLLVILLYHSALVQTCLVPPNPHPYGYIVKSCEHGFKFFNPQGCRARTKKGKICPASCPPLPIIYNLWLQKSPIASISNSNQNWHWSWTHGSQWSRDPQSGHEYSWTALLWVVRGFFLKNKS